MVKLDNDLVILKHMRQNARKSLTEISHHTSIPVSTVFDRLQKYEKGVIKRYTSLLNFEKIGYNVRVVYIISSNKRESLKGFLMKHRNVNNVYRLNNGYDFYAEAVFRNMKELEEFNEQLERFSIRLRQEHHIIEELAKERFFSV